MRQLLLMRHAKSSWKDAGLSDIDRPLNKRGRRDAPAMGRILAGRNVAPQLILSSPARRARDTALAVAEELGYPDSPRIEEDIYLADVDTLLQVIAAVGDDIDLLMMFGHNPGFTLLINRLTGTGLDNLPTAGVALIDLDIARWSDAVDGPRGQLRLLDFPKNHR